MLRCRKCRKGVIDSTCLTTDEATDEGSAAVCSIWHVNVDALPQWILAALDQAQWTAGKLNCHNCGVRLGSFNFIHHSKCPCAQDTNVHLKKSRVDCDHKQDIFIPQPRNMRLETSHVASPRVDSDNKKDSFSPHLRSSDASDGKNTLLFPLSRLHCVSDRRRCRGEEDATFRSSSFCISGLGEMSVVDLTTADRRRNDASTVLPVSHPSSHETDTEDGNSFVSGGRQLQTVEAPDSTTVHQLVSESSLFLRGRTPAEEGTEPRASSASRSLSRKERNHLKGQRRKRMRRERWLLRQQQPNSDDNGEVREDLTCCVCLDVYFRPHSCEPCGHVFCELCLRTLARNRRTRTRCPLCRTLILHANLHTELDQAVKTSFPRVYLRCQRNFTNTPAAKWPLPCCLSVKLRLTVTQMSHWLFFHGRFMCRFSKVTVACLLFMGLVVFILVFIF